MIRTLLARFKPLSPKSKKARAGSRESVEISLTAFYWLAGALSLTLLPHVQHLPWWSGILYMMALTWRWRAATMAAPLPGRWPMLLITLLAVAGVVLSYQTLFGRDAGIALLAAMAAMKFLELRTQRDGMILVILGYFLTMANLLYDQSLADAAWLLMAIAVLLAAQMLIQREHAGLPGSQSLRLGLRMMVQAIPLMLILFVLFPRIPGPLWGLPKDAHAGLTGLSDEMSPGAISHLIQSSEVAFRVRFQSSPPPSDRVRAPLRDT